MNVKEISWIRSNSKLCPKLKRYALQLYRPSRFTPCFLQKMERSVRLHQRRIPVIIQLDNVETQNLSTRDLSSLTGCAVKRKLSAINSVSAQVSEKTLKDLVANNKVKKIWYDSEVRTVLDHASPTVRAPHLWAKNLTGQGITIAVIDTGIYEHSDLAGRIIGFKDFVANRSKPYDDNGHGTHVAGCAASSGANKSPYRGPAPKAKLVGVKVLNKLGSGTLSSVIEGVQWCIEQKQHLGIRIINLSLGSEAYQSYRDDPLCQAVEKAWNSGIVVCAAAGNSGPEQRTIDSPGIDPHIITVGASHDRNIPNPAQNTVAFFSSRGPTNEGLNKPDFLAPGVDIVSLRSPCSQLDKANKESRVGKHHLTLSGTSMATPICAGVVAQLLQADGTLSPSQVKTMLINSATKIPNLHHHDQGAGVIDAYKAASQLPLANKAN